MHGTDPVSAMVTFLDGKPSKNDYSKYKIKKGEGKEEEEKRREGRRRREGRGRKEGRRGA
ncbi:hypothetical protein [Listeria monocytogenes]|uniref:hypothetical protein n=1 Tax=Listeria monocytogenes TaxID=1639 RepID=UPI003CC7CE30